MTDAQYEAKFKEMQKYIPFIQKVIEKLKVSNDQQGDNPRKAQLQKMEMLHGLLTNQAKKLKMETLLKCEGVLIKLHAKIEKHSTFLQNEDPLLKSTDSPKLTTSKTSTTTTSSSTTSSSSTPTTSASLSSSSQASKAKANEKSISSAPASPSPERTIIEDDVQPVVIPTERRISQDSDDKVRPPSSSDAKSKDHKSRSNDSRHRQQQHHARDSPKYDESRSKFQDARDRPTDLRNEGTKDKSDRHPSPLHHRAFMDAQHQSPSDRSSPLSHHRIAKDLHNHSTSKHQQQTSHKKEPVVPLPSSKSSNSSQILQTVKVVITEPIPANLAKRHFPPYHQYRYQQQQQPQNSPPARDAQRCLHNIEIKSADSKTLHDEAYNPDESWEKYNEVHNNSKNQSQKPIFHRLGEKVTGDTPATIAAVSPPRSSPIAIPGRSTCIPEVLKSPPLSASDINNLLKESGVVEHVSCDISEIGSRRAKKPENSNESKNSLDYVRKKFAQIAKIGSPQTRDSSPPSVDIKSAEKNVTSASKSSTPNERLALKYNPHPRQERLQSLSSNDGSECSQQSATRINDPRLKLKIQAASTPLPPVGVNVLPSVNVNDPRLKRQTSLSTPPSHAHLGGANNNPMTTSTSVITPPPVVSNYAARKDPRIARQLSTQPSTSAQPPARRLSVSQPYITPEQNWDSDAEDRGNINDPRFSKGIQRQLSTSLEKQAQSTPPIRRKSISQTPDFLAAKQYAANPPKDESEENWDSDTEPVTKETIIDPRLSRELQRQPPPQTTIPPMRRKSFSQTREVSAPPVDQLFIPNAPNKDMARSWDAKADVISPMSRDPSLLNNNPMARNSAAGYVPFGVQARHPPYLANPYVKNSLIPSSTPPPLVPFSSTPQHCLPGNTAAAAGTNRFNSSLNDSKERMRYFESKKPKPQVPRTYKEFKEAKERAAQALEAANKKAQEEVQAAAANKKLEETQATAELAKKKAAEEKTKKDSEQQEKPKTKTFDKNNKLQEKEKSSTSTKTKDSTAAALAGESTLDKMYRTQNFNTQFPKASISFKIPKKKTEEKPTEQTTATKDIFDSRKTDEKKSQPQEKTGDKGHEKATTTNNNAKPKKAAGQKTTPEIAPNTKAPTKKAFIPNPPKTDDTEENWDSETELAEPKSTMASDKDKTEASKSSTAETDRPTDKSETVKNKEDERPKESTEKSTNIRDPRCRPKESPAEPETGNNETAKPTKDVEGADKPATPSSNTIANTKKFLEETISLTFPDNAAFKPQRILRRRCTMVSIGSAPLVDKDKLLKANALMLEDIEERDKLKRKKEEEERQTARRNKHLEEMFQKTDDNCTVSTQNIITGKRRTRPSINFNETQNAINVFKHLSKKDTQTPTVVTQPATQQAGAKTTRSRAKLKAAEENAGSSEKAEERTDESKKSIAESDTDKKSAKFEVTKKDSGESEKNVDQDDDDDEKKCADDVNKTKKNIGEKDKGSDGAESSTTKECQKEEQSKAEKNSSENVNTKEQQAKDKDKETEQENPKPKTTGKKPKKVLGKAAAATVSAVNKKQKNETSKKPEEISPSDAQNQDDVSKKTNAEMPSGSKANTKAAISAEQPAPSTPIEEEHQICAVSSTSTELPAEETTLGSGSVAAIPRLKQEEVDDNEPSSTGSKSSNPTPTPTEDENSRHAFLNEFVQEIIKPNADKQHILSLLGQILSEDKLQIIKTVIDSTIKETTEEVKREEAATTKPIESKAESTLKNTAPKGGKAIKAVKHEEESAPEDDGEEHDDDEDDEDPDDCPSTSKKVAKSGKSSRKRNELERLNDDIRDMFICEGVLTATGKRMCTLMNQSKSKKETPETAPANKRFTQPTPPVIKAELDTSVKRRALRSKAATKTTTTSQPLRRSLRGCKTTEVSFENANDDEVEVTTYVGSSDVTGDANDTTPTRRKMPILKPHTPIKLPEETEVEILNLDGNTKRKQSNKPCPKSKKAKLSKEAEKESETEIESIITTESEDEPEEIEPSTTDLVAIKNTNVHWHNQSKYTSWCALCNKKILAISCSFHYKMHHGENYLSRLAPVLVQKFKQYKLKVSQPLFGVDRSPKQSSWFHRCPFCLQYFNTPMPLWLEHFQNHTAEFRYECSKCHWGSNRIASTRRHISGNCRGATIVNSVVKLTVPSVIKAHVCHLCNFLQLKRANLDRHYVEQHQLSQNNVELLGYTITLFDHADVLRVPEDKALAKEEEARKRIAKEESIIDVDDEEGCEEREEETATSKASDVDVEEGETTTAKAVEEADVPIDQAQAQSKAKADAADASSQGENETTEATNEAEQPPEAGPKAIETNNEKLDGKAMKPSKTTVLKQKQKQTESKVGDESPAAAIPTEVSIAQEATTTTTSPTKIAVAKVVTPTKVKIVTGVTTPPKVTIAKVLSPTKVQIVTAAATTQQDEATTPAISVIPTTTVKSQNETVAESTKAAETPTTSTTTAESPRNSTKTAESPRNSTKTAESPTKSTIPETTPASAATPTKPSTSSTTSATPPKAQIATAATKSSAAVDKLQTLSPDKKLLKITETEIEIETESETEEPPNPANEDECDPLMIVHDKDVTTIVPVPVPEKTAAKVGRPKNKIESEDPRSSKIQSKQKIEIEIATAAAKPTKLKLAAVARAPMKASKSSNDVTAADAVTSPPTVQIAARKYTLVFTGKDQGSLKEVKGEAKRKHPAFNCEIISKYVDAKEVQDELLSLAAQAAAEEDDTVETKQDSIVTNSQELINEIDDSKDVQDELITLAAKAAAEEQEKVQHDEGCQDQTTPKAVSAIRETKMSDLISNSIEMLFRSGSKRRKSDDAVIEEAGLSKKHCSEAADTSNVFVPSRLGTNSPPIQILAQSIVNIEEQDKALEASHKPATTSIAERLSQRFKVLQEKAKALKDIKAKDTAAEGQSEKPLVNPEHKHFVETNNKSAVVVEKPKESGEKPPSSDEITIISDDEDWEDIEITESAPNTGSYNSNSLQKAKSKGIFQKFGLFKGGNPSKSKKHMPPLSFLPKKKVSAKEKTPQPHSTCSSPITTKTDKTNANSTSPVVHLGFKPVINIMEDLLPDSPCNDPIDLVPELTPLEPLTDLNDISSILDSNLSAMGPVGLQMDESHSCIQDALDFISEQTAHEDQSQKPQVQRKTPTTNKIQNVGYSLQTQKENNVKFYCLLENCSFLFSSDAMGLENHFLCEHAQIKWRGYCLLCQAQCFPNDQDYSISKEIKHMVEKHVNRPMVEPNSDSSQHSATAGQGGEERPRIKLRRMTGDCLSTSNSESPTPSTTTTGTATGPQSNTLLGALLNAKQKPPTKEMPPQPKMPLTEPLLMDHTGTETCPPSSSSSFTNVSNDFVITSVASGAQAQSPFQISSVISLNQQQQQQQKKQEPTGLPKISNVCTLSANVGHSWAQQIEEEKQELLESAAASLEVSNILANASKPSYQRESSRRSQDDSPGPVVVAETVPVGQATAGNFVITQTVSAQYGDDSAAAVGFNISIQASALANIAAVTTNNEVGNIEVANILESAEPPAPNGRSRDDSAPPVTIDSIPPLRFLNMPLNSSSPTVEVTTPPITSRQYKCMANGCKFTTRVPVAMSDHLRFHERRNLSLKRDYFACAFCSYQAEDVDDYMKHSDQYHIISKGNKPTTSVATENDAAAAAAGGPVVRNICDILSKKMETTNASRNAGGTAAEMQRNLIVKQKESEEEYLKKLRATIDEIVGPTGFPDDKLYRCVIKNCRTQLTEATFHNHILYHISTLGISNPNNYIFKCPHCTAQYHRPAGIKAHIKNHARNRYFCYLCEETSANPGQMLKHFSEKHWHTLDLSTKELLKPKVITNTNGSEQVQDSCYYLTYTNELTDAEVRTYGEKLILEWQRKKSGSKTHFKSSEIDLLPMQPIFQREVNCGECEYKTKVRTNMYRHLLMHKQQPNNTGQTMVASVDPVNPVPCLNSSERFFDKMTNLASSSLIPSSSSSQTSGNSNGSKIAYKPSQAFVTEANRFKCGVPDCNYLTISDDILRSHLSTVHATAQNYRCPFCQEEICKRGMTVERVLNHLRSHGSILYRCEECNYMHHMRFVVERHINEKHAALKVNIVRHDRSEANVEGIMTSTSFEGKKYKDNTDAIQSPSLASSTTNSTPATRSSTGADTSAAKSTNNSSSSSSSNNNKNKSKWICDICKHKASTLGQIQMHCQNSHGQNKPYQCMHCQFGSQQLSQILYHIDEVHPDKTRNARYIYHKMANEEEIDVADTRPLWQRNDPTRVRHIRGILMEDEEESEKYRKATDDGDDDDDGNEDDDATNEPSHNFIKGYEFGCFHCDYKSERFDDMYATHYKNVHSSPLEMTKPFMFRLLRRLCCPDCRKFTGNFYEMQVHLRNAHYIRNFYAADITIAEFNDNSQRLICGYCSFHCSKTDHLMRHFQTAKSQHSPQDIRIDSQAQMMDMLKLGTTQTYFQCTLCSQIFGSRVSIVQHAINVHANEEGFSFKEQSNTLLYNCAFCSFSSDTETTLLRHMIDHYGRFKRCHFCNAGQISFEHYMQHCYAEHRDEIHKFRDIYTYMDISQFLLQMSILFPNGLMLSKMNLLKTQYGNEDAILHYYEEMVKVSQQPPIPRLSIARLVARKSIEAHHKQTSASSSPLHFTDIVEEAITTPAAPSTSARAKKITKRRCTVVAAGQDEDTNDSSSNKYSKSSTDAQIGGGKRKNSLVVEHESSSNQSSEFNVPLAHSKRIKKRRRTVASDHNDKSPSPSQSSQNSPQSFVAEADATCKKTKIDDEASAPAPSSNEPTSSPLDVEYFSYYGIKQEPLDLSKVYTKVAIGGINTPLTIDKFRLLFNIDCQLKLTKCDVSHVPAYTTYTHYKHIKKACPASHKLRFS